MYSTTHELSIMGEHFLHNIMAGKKKFEGRIYTEKCKSMQVGDLLKLSEKEANWAILCKISSLHPFSSFNEMLETLGVLSLLPQLEPMSHTHTHSALVSEGIKIYESFPGSERVTAFGCIAIGVTFLQKYR